MKKIFFFVFAILTLTIQLSSQWVYQPVPGNTSYYVCIEFSSTTNGAVGGIYLTTDFFGRGAYTTNAGANWLNSTVPDSLRVITGIVLQASGTGYSTGAYNTAAITRPINPEHYNKRTLQLNKQHESFTGNNYKGMFMRTTNTGQSWAPYGVLPANVYYLNGIDQTDFNTLYAAASYNPSGGVSDGVVKTTNAGLTWTVLTMPEVINNVSGVYFIDINTGFAYGYDNVNDTARGVLLRTTNAGVNWSRQIFMQYGELSGIDFTNSTTGILVSISGILSSDPDAVILRTTNAGLNWISAGGIDNADMYDVNFVQGTLTALITGARYLPGFESAELILKSTNSGSNWIQLPINDTGLVLFESKLLDQNNWYLTGADFGSPTKPVILHTTNGGAIGILPISGEVPVTYSLQQNYPNPFNPVTNIKFSIPVTGFVKLVIFDVTGREVKTLVSQNMQAGNYIADLDASSLTSGVYFYRIEAGEYMQTKKMVLIK